MVVLLALLMLAPFIVVGATIADNAAMMARWGRDFLRRVRPIRRRGSPAALIGPTVAAYWSSMAHDTAKLLGVLRDYVEPLRKFGVASGASVVGAILQMALAIFIAWFMFRDGHAIVGHLRGARCGIAGDGECNSPRLPRPRCAASCSGCSGPRWCRASSRASDSGSPGSRRRRCSGS